MYLFHIYFILSLKYLKYDIYNCFDTNIVAFSKEAKLVSSCKANPVVSGLLGSKTSYSCITEEWKELFVDLFHFKCKFVIYLRVNFVHTFDLRIQPFISTASLNLNVTHRGSCFQIPILFHLLSLYGHLTLKRST